ncbi:hypothetical protein FG382_16885 [Psychrobacillus lasiicapitis]|uniref:Uncharacterized protein n=1 Tax=Psychrobacillus lasiicapitis TaxID=1636719 RepID=A0A544T077_9BACI|nr:hypothetical protein FG382_16885 [Psychrobacillus lasiicapitis]
MKKIDDKIIYCYCCQKRTLFIRRDMKNNSGVESHCSECSLIWFEWQNRAVEREKEKWIEFNGGIVNTTRDYIQIYKQ